MYMRPNNKYIFLFIYFIYCFFIITVNPFNLAFIKVCEFEVNVIWHPYNLVNLKSLKTSKCYSVCDNTSPYMSYLTAWLPVCLVYTYDM